MNLVTKENRDGHYIMDDEHNVFLLIDKERFPNATHTRYLEDAKNHLAYAAMFEHEFTKYFEKLYFNDNDRDYDWWEKEEEDVISVTT